MSVNPGTLVADVCHFKEVGIQPSLLNRLLEERFMGPRGARGDNHPVKFMLLDLLLDQFLGILGTCI